jgi:hypothetical protein
MYSWTVDKLIEKGVWTVEWSPSINPVKPDYFDHALNPDGSREVFCVGKAFAGALIKNTATLLYPCTNICMSFGVKFGQSLVKAGRVIETDMKITDADGWTYDGSFQFNISEDWMTQTFNPWVDTGTKQPLVAEKWNPVVINYKLDYVNRTIAINDGAARPASKVGWTPKQIVSQLQLCTNGGFYSVTFSSLMYTGHD